MLTDKDVKIYECNSINKSSNDNLSYKKHIVLSDDEMSKSICIEIADGVDNTKVIIDTPPFTNTACCSFQYDNKLVLILDYILCIFDINKLEITNKIETEISDVFGVYRYNDDLIIHTEMIIYRIDKDLNFKWDYTGKDIFVAYDDNKYAFEMKEDKICLYDFLDDYYEIDYDGNILLFVESEV